MVFNKRKGEAKGLAEIITDGNGDGSLAIVFEEPMDNATYGVVATNNEAEDTGISDVSAKTVNGFTLGLDAAAHKSTEVIDASSVTITLDDNTQELIDASGNTVTFADDDPDTITRASGDWTTRFAAGDSIVITGSTSNNQTVTIDSLTATVITLVIGDVLVSETNTTLTITYDIVAPTIASKITRASGSWLTNPFAVGDTITVSDDGSDINAGTYTITAITATIITLTLLTDVLVQEANSTDTFTFLTDNGVDVGWYAFQTTW